MKNNCLIYNYAQHYRLGIFTLLDKSNSFDFFFGDSYKDIKKIDYSKLSNFKSELKNQKIISHIYWQKGAVKLFFKPYNQYLILGEYYCLSTWVILLLSKFSKKKVFLWSHGWYGNEGRLKKAIKKVFFRLSDGLFLYGNYAKNLMIDQGFKEEKLHVIFNSLDYKNQVKVRGENKKNDIFKNHFNNTNPVLIFIGRLTKVKRIDLLISAIKELKESKFNLNLVLVGAGEEKENLVELVKNSDLEKNCWFYGKSYNEQEIGNLIFNADVCVSPGNVGLTAMHSLVFGTPVISNSDFKSQMPEFEAIKKGVTGDFFEKDNAKDLAVVIRNWLENHGKNEEECYQVIDKFYNPDYQYQVIMNNMK